MKLKELRLTKNLTQKQLADKIDVTWQQIQKWENGTRKPKLEALKKLAAALECDLMDLIEDK